MGSHNRNAETAHSIGLNGKSSLIGHRLNNSFHIGASLHGLIGCEVTDVPGTYCEDVFSKECKLRVHHPLNHGSSINSGDIIVFEGRHKRDCACGNNELLRIYIKLFIGSYVLYCKPFTFENIPYDTIQKDPFMGVAGKCLCNIESPHSAESLLLLKEEELVGLHKKLTSDVTVII